LVDGGGISLNHHENGALEVWNVSTCNQIQAINTDFNVYSVALSPSGTGLLVGGSNGLGGLVQIWDASTGRVLKSLSTAATTVNSVAFSPDGELVAVGGGGVGGSGVLEIWSATTGKLCETLDPASNEVNGVAFSPDGRSLAVGGINADLVGGFLELWNASTGRLVRSFSEQFFFPRITSLSFSPDGRALASGTDLPASPVTLWDVSSGRPKTSLWADGVYEATTVAYSPDGSSVAGGGTGPSPGASVWNAGSGACRFRVYMYPAIGGVSSLAFNPDGKVLFVSSSNGLEAYSTAGGQPLAEYSRFGAGSVSTLAISRDGSFLVLARSGNVLMAANPFYHRGP
jgi:WD40 repeat protein